VTNNGISQYELVNDDLVEKGGGRVREGGKESLKRVLSTTITGPNREKNNYGSS